LRKPPQGGFCRRDDAELVARKITEPLRQLEEFTHTSQVIDGYEASVWRDSGT
jgi:hypothetical protein